MKSKGWEFLRMLLKANYSGCLVHLEETHPFYHPSGTRKAIILRDMGSFHSSRIGMILGETVCGLLGTYWQEKRKIIQNNSGSSVLPGSTGTPCLLHAPPAHPLWWTPMCLPWPQSLPSFSPKTEESREHHVWQLTKKSK